jgi:hypothetical protein
MGSMSCSRIMDAKGKKMIEGNLRTQVRLAQHLQDIRLIVAAGKQAGQTPPLSTVHQQLLEAAVSAGLGVEDNSALPGHPAMQGSLATCDGRVPGRGGALMQLAQQRPDPVALLSSGPIVEPSLQRRVAFGRRSTKKQILHTDVLVQLRPVNSTTTSDQSPIPPFLCSPMAKARVPKSTR